MQRRIRGLLEKVAREPRLLDDRHKGLRWDVAMLRNRDVSDTTANHSAVSAMAATLPHL